MEMATHSSRKAEIGFDPDPKEFTYHNEQCLILGVKFRHHSEALIYPYHDPNRIHFHKELLAKNIFHATNKKAFDINVSES